MAYSTTIKLVTGDTLPELVMTLRDSNTAASGQTLDPNNELTWAPIDLTGATVRLRIRPIGVATLHATITCTLSDAENGVVVSDFDGAEFTAAGEYEGEVEITFASGGIQTVEQLIKFKVREDFD